jgi:hypothetical protein
MRDPLGAERTPMTLLRVVASLVLVTSPPRRHFQDSTPTQRVEAALARISTLVPHESGAEVVEDAFDPILETFYRYPTIAARLLCQRLQVTASGVHRDHPAVVWYIRALRSLTGLDFTAPTAAQLPDTELPYLRPDKTTGNVHFFGWHMAWDDTWLAPRDAQQAIIHRWQAWFASEGQTFKYVNNRHHNDWYF